MVPLQQNGENGLLDERVGGRDGDGGGGGGVAMGRETKREVRGSKCRLNDVGMRA